MSAEMNSLFEQINNIPQVPEVVRDLIIQLNDPNLDMYAIAKNVTRDQIISMKVLRLVNSAHFSLPRKLSSIEEAVVTLGMKQLKSIIIASGMVQSMPEIKGFDIKNFWSDSFRTATYAKWIADEINANSDMAFTVGLISEMGIVLMYMGLPEAIAKIDKAVKNGQVRAQMEKEVLGYTNSEVCAELCRRWKFPEDLANTVSQCKDPLSFEEVTPEACIVNIAQYLSTSRRDDLSIEEMMTSFPLDVLAKLGLDQNQLTEKLPILLDASSGLESLAA
ncbi:MAG: HDOD domain-containing protein [Gammaproteobacteria bacterium]